MIKKIRNIGALLSLDFYEFKYAHDYLKILIFNLKRYLRQTSAVGRVGEAPNFKFLIELHLKTYQSMLFPPRFSLCPP